MGLSRSNLAGAAIAVAAVVSAAGLALSAGLQTRDALAAGAAPDAQAAAVLAQAPRATRDARLSRIATALVGSGPVRVDCVERSELERRAGTDAWGLAERERRRVSLLAPFCRFLAGVTGTTPGLPAYHAGPALLVFAHELEHIKGASAEALAECRALRSLRRVATAGFGATDPAWLAAALAAARDEHERTPPAYRTPVPGCKVAAPAAPATGA